MNIIAGIIFAAVCTYVGIALREQMRHRTQLLSGVQIFAASFVSNLSFLQLHLKQFVETQANNNTAVVKRLLKDFCTYLDSGAEGAFEVDYVFLESSDKQILGQFFTFLGKGNSVGQMQQTKEFSALLKSHLDTATQILNTKGNLYAKLGMAVGLVLGIVVL